MQDPTSKPLKLFVWEDVLYAYTGGLAVALAPDVETARLLIADKYDTEIAREYIEIELEKPPIVCEEPAAFLVSGGG